MAKYKSYLHIERLDKPECDGLLQNNNVYITAKVDGTNAVVWYDKDKGEVCGGSRKRELTLHKDNANFYSWLMSGQDEAIYLRNFVTANPDMIVYGEWLGLDKFIGSIKSYNPSALGHMYIFDVFDIEEKCYLHEEVWREELSNYNLNEWFVPILACLDHPSYEDVVNIAENNHFLLDTVDSKGEGIVCKVPGWTNNYGHICYGKIVLDEFNEQKRKSKYKPKLQRENIEKDVVEYLVTESELTKTKAKVCVLCEANKFDVTSKKMIGMFLNMIFNDLLEEMNLICKKWKNPIVNFAILKAETQNKGRKFLGLV